MNIHAVDLVPTQSAPSLPALVDRAAAALTSARTAAEVLEAKEMAAVAYDVAKRAARLARAKQAHDDLIAAAYRAQADALEIEAGAKRRLADEYDAAQKRGELRAARERTTSKAEAVGAADIGLTHKQVHEARAVRDAEKASPGVVRRAIDSAIAAGKAPTRAHIARSIRERALDAIRPPQPRRGREAIRTRVSDAIGMLAGLPDAREVAAYFRGTDEGLLMTERLPGVAAWIEEFHSAWIEVANARD